MCLPELCRTHYNAGHIQLYVFTNGWFFTSVVNFSWHFSLSEATVQYVRQTDVCSDTICEIFEETTCLEVLDVTLSNTTDPICDHVCKYARKLRVLKFDTDYEVPLPWSKEKISAVLQCCGSLHTLGIGGKAPLDISQMRELLSGSVWKQLCTIMCYEVSDSFLTSVFKESIQVSPTSRPRLCVCDSLNTLKNSSEELLEVLEVFKCKHF